MATPDEVNRARALRVRGYWRRPELRARAAERLDAFPAADPAVATWRAVLAGTHPLVAWLDGDQPPESLPACFDDGLTPRLIFASHPFPPVPTWSSLPPSP
ncbi:MAG: hypothetical protein FJ102_14515 [Deltaproteobacteria bacterium]|nr:hypothetical protein [Deltaproteobacteria bacterium]